ELDGGARVEPGVGRRGERGRIDGAAEAEVARRRGGEAVEDALHRVDIRGDDRERARVVIAGEAGGSIFEAEITRPGAIEEVLLAEDVRRVWKSVERGNRGVDRAAACGGEGERRGEKEGRTDG